MIYIFEDYILDSDKHVLLKSNNEQNVEPRVFELIYLLIKHRDRLVTKDEIYEKIWDNRFISESSISTSINLARIALGDDGRRQRVIKTIHNKGFRFTGTITEGMTLVYNSMDANPEVTPRDIKLSTFKKSSKFSFNKSHYFSLVGIGVLGFSCLFLIPNIIKAKINHSGDDKISITSFKPGDTIDGSTGTDVIDFSTEKLDGYTVHLFEGKIYKSSDKTQENIISIVNVENIIGTEQDDVLNGGVNGNVIKGGSGNDIINGNGGIDTIYGGSGNDIINGGYRLDRLFGQAGDDIFYISTISAGDDIDGGNGQDTVNYSTFTHSGVKIDLINQSIEEHEDRKLGPYSIINVEHIIGSPQDDLINGDNGSNRIMGGGGSDEINGREGIDIAIYKGRKNDYEISRESEDNWIVTTIASKENIDKLYNIEKIEFSDETINIEDLP